MKPRRRPRTFEPQRTSREEPVHERPSAALSVGLACSRTNQYALRASPPSALHLAIPEQAPTFNDADTQGGAGAMVKRFSDTARGWPTWYRRLGGLWGLGSAGGAGRPGG